MTDWAVSENRSPYKRIPINDPVPITPAPVLEYWEQDLERVAERARLERGERVWRAVVASAEASNMSVRPAEPQDETASAHSWVWSSDPMPAPTRPAESVAGIPTTASSPPTWLDDDGTRRPVNPPVATPDDPRWGGVEGSQAVAELDNSGPAQPWLPDADGYTTGD